MTRHAVLVAGFVALYGFSARADVDPKAYIPATVGDTVPDTIALEMLGSPDLKVIRPGSLQSLVTELQAFYKDGQLVPGTAIEFVPYSLAGVTHRDYVKSKAKQFASRLSLSLATIAAGQDNKDVRAAVGFRIRFIDETDWRLNEKLLTCAKGVLDPADPDKDTPPAPGPASSPPTPEETMAALKKCHDDHTRWNANQLALAGGVSTVSPMGAIDTTAFDTASGYFGGAWGPENSRHWLFLFALRYTYHASQDATATRQFSPALHVGGGGVRIQFKADRFSLIAEGGAGFTYDGTANAKGLAGLTVQYRIIGNTWFELGASADINGGSRPSQLFALTNLKWSYDVLPSEPK